MLNQKEYTYEELVTLISTLIKQKRYYEDDIVDTNNILNDSKIDYLAKREYLNDLRDDNNELRRIDDKLKELFDYAFSKNITINIDSKKLS